MPDKDGRFLGVLNRKLDGFRSKDISSDTLSYTDLYNVFYQLFRACADEPLLKYAKDNNTFSEYWFIENNEERYIEGKIEGKGEVIKSVEYHARIVGLSSLYQAYFSVEIQSDFTVGSNISDDYKKLNDSGLFRIINTNTRFIDCFDKQGSWDKSFISDKLNRRYLGIRFLTITQENLKCSRAISAMTNLCKRAECCCAARHTSSMITLKNG